MNELEKNKMGILPIGRLLFTMSLPVIISMMIQACYNVVDSIFVAMLSEDALAAVTLIFPVQMMIISVGVGTGIGLSSLIARRLGERRFDEANLAASHGFLLAVFSWIAVALFGIFLTRNFVGLFADDAGISSMSISYCQITSIFSLFIFIQINIEKTLQATGNTLFPMIFNIIGCLTNVVLDPVLIFGLFGMPKLGVPGAAIATVIGQVVAMVIALFMLFKFKHPVHISFRNFRIHGSIIRDIYAVGLPSIVMQGIGSFTMSGMNAILASHSSTAVAVMGVYFRVQSLVFMPMFGLNQGALPIIGYNYGAKNKARLMRCFKMCVVTAICIMACGLVAFQVFPVPILRVFNASPQMMDIGIWALRAVSICFIPAGFCIASAALFQGLAHGMLSMIVSVLRQIFFLLPIAWFLSKYYGLHAVWFSYPAAESIAVVLTIIFLRYVYGKEIKNLGIEH